MTLPKSSIRPFMSSRKSARTPLRNSNSASSCDTQLLCKVAPAEVIRSLEGPRRQDHPAASHLNQLEGIASPILATRLHNVQVAQQQDCLGLRVGACQHRDN